MPPEVEGFRVSRADSELLRATTPARAIGVDREKKVLRGYVVMQLGLLKDRPGEADQATLDKLVELGNARKQGVKARFAHPTECADGLGKYLGRSKDFFLSEVVTRDGKTVPCVRADLHFDPTALDTPPQGGKPLAVYTMDLAESDPDAVSSSIVVRFKREFRVEPDGTRKKNEKGEELPPLLRPLALFASDVVDEGAAVDGLFSAADLPNGHLWEAESLLDGLFPDATREELAGRLGGWVDRYLESRFGPAPKLAEQPAAPPPPPAPTPPQPEAPPAKPAQPSLSALERRQRQREREAAA